MPIFTRTSIRFFLPIVRKGRQEGMSILTLKSWTTDRGAPQIEKAEPRTRVRPIELQTENRFSIIRRCDVAKCGSIGGATHSFIVRDPYGYELDITQHIGQTVEKTDGGRHESFLASCIGFNSCWPIARGTSRYVSR